MTSQPTPLPWDPIAEAHRQWREHGWSDAADGMALVASVMRVQQLMLGSVQGILKPLGLSFSRYEMLRLLAFTRGGALPMASASARLQVHPTSVTSTVDRLERDGLVQREAHPSDGRATLVRITDTGRTVVERATTLLNDEFFDEPGLESRDVTELVRLLARFRRGAGDFDDPIAPPDPL